MSYSRLQHFKDTYQLIAESSNTDRTLLDVNLDGIVSTSDMLSCLLRAGDKVVTEFIIQGFKPNQAEMSLEAKDGYSNHWLMLIERGLYVVFNLLLRHGVSPRQHDMSGLSKNNVNGWYLLLKNGTIGREIITNLYSMHEVFPTSQDMDVRGRNENPTAWYLAVTQMPELIQALIRRGVAPSRESACQNQVLQLNLWCLVLNISFNERFVTRLIEMIRAVKPHAADIFEHQMSAMLLKKLMNAVTDQQFIALTQILISEKIFPQEDGIVNLNFIWARLIRCAQSGERLALEQQLLRHDLIPLQSELCQRSAVANSHEIVPVELNYQRPRRFNRAALLLARDDLSVFYGFMFYMLYQNGIKSLNSTNKTILFHIGKYLLPSYLSREQFNDLLNPDNIAIVVKYYLSKSLAEYRNKFALFKSHELRAIAIENELKYVSSPDALCELVCRQAVMAITPGKTVYKPKPSLREHAKPFKSHIKDDFRDQAFKAIIKTGYFLVRQLAPKDRQNVQGLSNNKPM